jgi:hypothetical protein
MSDLRVLACTRVADLPEPSVRSIRGRCARCEMQVWIALSSPSAGNKIWCMQCALDEMEVQPEVYIDPPTPEQMRDLKRELARRKRGS